MERGVVGGPGTAVPAAPGADLEDSGYPVRDELLQPTEPLDIDELPAAPPPRRRPVWRSPWLLLLLALAILLGGVAVAYAVSRGGGRSRAAETPSTTAPAATPSAPSTPATTTAHTAPPTRAGTATSGKTAARPAADAAVATVVVPQVVGEPASRAVADLRQAGLGVAITKVTSTRPEAEVVTERPISGTKLRKGATVTIAVSVRPLAVVPDVSGLTLAAARRALRRRDLGVSVRWVPNVLPRGHVVAQSPKQGRKLERGKHVFLTVSTGSQAKPASGASASSAASSSAGPSTVAVPDVTGEDEATATADLEGAGFTVASADEAVTDPAQDGVVVDQSPAGGSDAADGSTVTIYVGRTSTD